jgi:geranylgeranyl diphosphate synthase type I
MSVPNALKPIKDPVDRALLWFLSEQRVAVGARDPDAAVLIDELERVVRSGGKRLRPAFCYWGYRAAGGIPGEPIVRVAAALELFHTFALIHDDVMDEAETRRGAETTRASFARARGSGAYGTAMAILVGDLALVLGDQLFMESGFPADVLAAGFHRYTRMRVDVAAGQFLDLAGSGRPSDEERARRISSLKSGGYTVEGPLQIGAILGGASEAILSVLSGFGKRVGEAFQIRDDVASALGGGPDLAQGRPTFLLAAATARAEDRDRRFIEQCVGRTDLPASERDELVAILVRSGAVTEAERLVALLVDEALRVLTGAPIDPQVAGALEDLAGLIAGTKA